MQLEKKK